MKSLRVLLIVYAVTILVGSYFIFRSHGGWLLGLYLAINGLATVIGIVFERGRYTPKVDSSGGDWETTNEKFQDATTGTWMVVRFNPKTGERDYVELEKTDANK